MLRNGSSTPSLFNDEVIISTLFKAIPGVSLEDARDYAIVGCVEQVVGASHFGSTGFFVFTCVFS